MSMSNQPGTPRDDGEMGGNFLNPFQSESVSIFLWSCFTLGTFVPGILFKRKKKYIQCSVMQSGHLSGAI